VAIRSPSASAGLHRLSTVRPGLSAAFPTVASTAPATLRPHRTSTGELCTRRRRSRGRRCPIRRLRRRPGTPLMEAHGTRIPLCSHSTPCHSPRPHHLNGMLTVDAGKLSNILSPSSLTPSYIIVGNGALLPVTATGSHTFSFPHRNLVLNEVLVSPNIIKNLISFCRVTTDNNCSIEFDPFGLSVKDLHTRNVIARCNSSGDLYPFYPPATSTSALLAAPTSIWHLRLGHPGREALSKLISSSVISCNKDDLHPLCHACQLGHHTRLPFGLSSSRATNNFDLIHYDL
jgi:hypothetical protein